MATDETPGLISRIGHGLSAGLCAGSLVGVSEAAWILTSTTPSEYQAIRYGAVLYGLMGGMGGLGIGIGTAILARFVNLSPARAWCFSFFAIASGMGLVIIRYILNKQVYLEQGVPMTTTLGILTVMALMSLVGIWLGGNILTKTPLRVLPSLKGTVVGWGGGVALAWLFSMSPAPGAAGTMAPHPKQGPEYAGKPDVILVMVDTLRADALGVYGNKPDASPNLDAFSKDAVVFDQFITSASWTRASTASLLTSRYPSSHTCETKDAGLPESVTTLAEQLSANGYATGGLPNNANVTAAVGFGQGFSYYPYTPEYPLAAAESSYALSMYSVARKVYARFNNKKAIEEYYMPAPTQFKKAQAFIQANNAEKWFLFVHIMDAHDPYFEHPWNGVAYGRAEYPNPPAEWKDKLRGLYAGEVKYLDSAFGDFVAQLKKDGRYDNALIIVTADHGEEFMEHGGWWHGTTLYDEQIRVPLLVKLPKNQYAGSRVPWQVRQVDIAPTITAALGFDPGDGWQGQDLFDDNFETNLAGVPGVVPEPVEGQPEAPPPPPTILAWDQNPASRDAVSEQNFEGYDLESFRSKGFKLIQVEAIPAANSRITKGDHLFDLMNDPGETHELAGTGDVHQGELGLGLQNALETIRHGKAEAVTTEQSCSEIDKLISLGYMTEDGRPDRCKGEQK